MVELAADSARVALEIPYEDEEMLLDCLSGVALLS